MDPTDLITKIPVQHQLYALEAYLILKLLGQFIGAVRGGGGLRRILLSLWYGDTVPKAIAQDVRQVEANKKVNAPRSFSS